MIRKGKKRVVPGEVALTALVGAKATNITRKKTMPSIKRRRIDSQNDEWANDLPEKSTRWVREIGQPEDLRNFNFMRYLARSG